MTGVSVDDRRRAADALAAALDAGGINYAVATGLERYPDALGRDLDIVVQPDQLAPALEHATARLRQDGWSIVRISRLNGHVWCFVCSASHTVVLEFDLIGSLHWGPATLLDRPKTGARRGPFRYDPWATFAKSILLQILATGDNFPKLQRKLDGLSLSSEDMSAIVPRLEALLGGRLAQALLHLAATNDAEGIVALRPEVRQAVLASALTTRLRMVPGALQFWVRNKLSISPLARPVIPIVSIVGPDGVGKSTVIREIGEQIGRRFPFYHIHFRHWRPRLLPELGTLIGKQPSGANGPTAPRRSPGRLSAVRLAYYYVDFVLGHWLKDRRAAALMQLVLYDRCALDMAVDPVRYGLPSPRCARLMWHLVPKPHLIVLIDDESKRIRDRKPELSETEIARQLNDWKELARTKQIHAVVNAKGGPERAATEIVDLVMEMFCQRGAQ